LRISGWERTVRCRHQVCASRRWGDVMPWLTQEVQCAPVCAPQPHTCTICYWSHAHTPAHAAGAVGPRCIAFGDTLETRDWHAQQDLPTMDQHARPRRCCAPASPTCASMVEKRPVCMSRLPITGPQEARGRGGSVLPEVSPSACERRGTHAGRLSDSNGSSDPSSRHSVAHGVQ
jgi:hypothetical protein